MRRLALALSLVLAACAAPSEPDPPDDVARTSSPIIKGADSDASQDAVVLIMHYDALQAGGSTDGCTGVMLTPELVLTARHCVSVTDPSAACSSDGTALAGGQVTSDHKPSALYVFAGNKRPDLISGLGKAARGAEIITTGAKTICNNDLALILLDRKLEGAKIAPVRLDGGPARGELVTVVGWGITDTETFPSTRQTRDGVKITDVGPARALGPAEFKTGEGTCSGDSGGPALASETGAVLGVLSRGGNGTGGQGAENCVDGENVFTGVAQHKDTVLAAYAKTGQEPWLEGSPNPRLGKLGAGCAADDGCQSGICNGVCTQACDVDPCPGGWTCGEANGRQVCLVTKKDEGGCATSPARASSSWIAIAAAALVAARRHQRRRR